MTQRYYRKIIRIEATDSPNVQLGLAQQAAGIEPTDEVLLPGVLTWGEYQNRLKTWDDERQCVGLRARHYAGPQIMLFPESWLARADQLARSMCRGAWGAFVRHRQAKGGGNDPAEGGDSTCLSAVDELGLIELTSQKTSDTDKIPGMTLAFMRKHNIESERFCFDRGGGGKQHADRLRGMGFPVRTVAFGEAVTLQPRRGMRPFAERLEQKEDRYVYVNRRAELYHELSLQLDPAENPAGFAIPGAWAGPQYAELHRQLSKIPRTTDGEGRYFLIPKDKSGPNDTRPTLKGLLGCSPDESDSVTLALYSMLHRAVARSHATAG